MSDIIEDFISDLEFKPDPQQEQDFKTIESALKAVKPFGLEVEVIYETCNQIKSDPNLTISQAIQNALWEWDC